MSTISIPSFLWYMARYRRASSPLSEPRAILCRVAALVPRRKSAPFGTFDVLMPYRAILGIKQAYGKILTNGQRSLTQRVGNLLYYPKFGTFRWAVTDYLRTARFHIDMESFLYRNPRQYFPQSSAEPYIPRSVGWQPVPLTQLPPLSVRPFPRKDFLAIAAAAAQSMQPAARALCGHEMPAALRCVSGRPPSGLPNKGGILIAITTVHRHEGDRRRFACGASACSGGARPARATHVWTPRTCRARCATLSTP